jgi:hypothetical protein
MTDLKPLIAYFLVADREFVTGGVMTIRQSYLGF